MDDAMKMRWLCLSILALTVSCSSSSKKAASSSPDDSSEAPLVTDMATTPSETAAAMATVKPRATDNTAAIQQAQNNLKAAVRAQSDDGIYKAAVAVLVLKPDDAKALNAMGMFHLRKGRPLAAQLFFDKALQAQPNASEIQSNIGLAHLNLKEEPEAFRAFKKAIEMNPSDTSAVSNLGSLYLEKRDFKKAYAMLSLSSGRNHDLKFLNNFAIACAEMGKPDQAESLYREALKASPTNRDLLLNYATLQIEYQGKKREGLETLERLKVLGLEDSMRNQTNVLENHAKAGLK